MDKNWEDTPSATLSNSYLHTKDSCRPNLCKNADFQFLF